MRLNYCNQNREATTAALVDLLARRPELRDVGIAGYLVGAAVEGAPGMPKTRVRWYLRGVTVRAWEAAA